MSSSCSACLRTYPLRSNCADALLDQKALVAFPWAYNLCGFLADVN
jgi:hypothetical protein